MIAAARLLAEARDAGLRLRVANGGLRLKPANANTPPDPALLDRLRQHKAELLALLSGDACRHCGEAIAWTPDEQRRCSSFLARPATAFADGTGAHLDCCERAEVERLLAAGRRAVESVDALADEAETLFMGPLP